MIRAIKEKIQIAFSCPFEYPLKESLRIYVWRLAIFLAVVLANFILFGFVLGIARFSSWPPSITIPTLIAMVVILITIGVHIAIRKKHEPEPPWSYEADLLHQGRKGMRRARQKPQMIPRRLPEPWMQGTRELYFFTEKIVAKILDPGKPLSGGKPPYGFSKDDFKRKWVSIDPNQIFIILSDDKESAAVLFPATLNPNNPERHTEIWVGGCLTRKYGLLARERENVEFILKDALEEVQSMGPNKKVEDKAWCVQISLNTLAAIGYNKEKVEKIIMDMLRIPISNRINLLSIMMLY